MMTILPPVIVSSAATERDPPPPDPPLPADAGAYKKCTACHSLQPARHGIGPSLAGVYGRAAATQPGFRYSEQLRGAGLTWDAATLDRFLTNPRAAVPGTKMAFRGLSDPVQRAQVIAFLQRH